MTTRAQALEPVVSYLAREAEVDRFIVFEALHDWTVIPHLVGGVVVACAIMNGSEIHFAVAPEFRRRLLTRANIRAFLAPLLAKQGFLTTRHMAGFDSADIKFIRRLGFKQTWTADETTYYMLTSLPFERKSK